MTDKTYKRSILLIKPKFQYKFIGLILATVLVAIGIIAVDMFTSLGRYLSDTGGDVNGLYANIRFALAVKVIVYAGGVAFLALVVSHKVAGPIYRLQKSTDAVCQGDLTMPVFLRTGDELMDLRESFNDMLSSLREKVSTDLSRLHTLRRLVEEVLQKNPALSPESAQKLREALAEVEKMSKTFKI